VAKRLILAALAILLVTSAASGAHAKHAKNATATLVYRTNLGAGETRTIVMRNGVFRYQGQEIARDAVARNSDRLAEIFAVRGDHSDDPQCSAGSFKHTVTRDGRKQVEWGCLSDARFTELARAFDGLTPESPR
jgi:hypothetical protein